MISHLEIGQNLKIIRKSQGMTQEYVSNALGISRTAISLIETGKRKINTEELARIVDLYNITISEILNTNVKATLGGFEMLFRAESISKEDLPRISEFQDLCRRYAELEKRLYGKIDFSLPLYKYPENEYYAKKMASDERRRLDLGTAPIKDIFSLFDRQGVRLFKLPLNSWLSGCFAFNEGLGPCILLNLNHGLRMVFTAAHEYFHCLVHRDNIANICEDYDYNKKRTRKKSKKESIADIFAANFLMPEESVYEAFSEYLGNNTRITDIDIIFLSQYFGVSYKSMLVRLNSIRLISNFEFDKLNIVQPEKLAEKENIQLLKPSEDKLPGKYVLMATRLYLQEKISIGKLAEYLKVTTKYTQDFVKRLLPYAESAQLV